MGMGLVDLSGLSGDPESDDRAEKLLARWETEIMNSSASASASASPPPLARSMALVAGAR